MVRTNFDALLCLLSLNALLVQAQSIASRAYVPVAGACPEGFTLVRMAGSSATNQSLSASEVSYVQSRRSQVIPQAWKSYLASVESTNIPLPSYVSSILDGSSTQTPSFGIAVSGGGYRATIFDAGVLNALDGRNASSNNAGLGGLLQAATYLTGLSGGSWLVTSLAQADFPTIQELIFGYPDPAVANDAWGGWNAEHDTLTPSSNSSINTKYLRSLLEELEGKYRAGYAVTSADYWGRMLARHFTNGTFSENFYNESCTHGAGVLWSLVAETESFVSHSIPFPIVTTGIFEPDQNNSNAIPGNVLPVSSLIMEFNVFEMGSFDPMLSAFTPTKYLGTRNNSVCVTNFDQLSLLVATATEVFNQLNLTDILAVSEIGPELSSLNSTFPEAGIELDIASWPNPFYGIAPETFVAFNQTDLSLVDAGEDSEKIPFQPLLVKARAVDVILATDSSEGDMYYFANGSSMIATQDRVALLSPVYSFPPVPKTVDEFVSQNLTTRPTFFGCDVTSANASTPLVIYIANGGPPRDGAAPLTNTSTLQSSYNASEIQGILEQTFVVATQGYPVDADALADPEWPACLACSIVDRARERAGETRSGVCERCFERYCWPGSD